MIVRHKEKLKVNCPNDGFVSHRYLLEDDNMGFTLTKTVIPKGDEQRWHYKNHLEACYCISGTAELIDLSNGDSFIIKPGTMYALDKNDEHLFIPHDNVVLLCVFNPPLKGEEVHQKDGSYKLEK